MNLTEWDVPNVLKEITSRTKVPFTSRFSHVKKRDGSLVLFDQKKITSAIYRAMHANGEGDHDPMRNAQRVSDYVVRELSKRFPTRHTPHIEEIQDIVEEALIVNDFPKTAKGYILYRNKRAEIRERRKTVPQYVQDVAAQSKKYFRNSLAEFIYYRSYSRWIEEGGRRETWIETVERFMDFMRTMLKKRLLEREYKEIHEAIISQEVMPSMRLMWSAGKAVKTTNVSAYNCSFIAPSRIKDFSEIMYLLMCGTGVGFSVESQTAQRLPIIKRQRGVMLRQHTIGDSKEGWGEALTLGLKTWYAGKDITFNYRELRPAGARLNTMGGRSSGPEPLRALLDFAREKIFARQGKRLRNIDVHDIICKIGEVVVMGGVRRCLPQNTLIHTEGGLKPIKNILPGEKVLTTKGKYRKVIASEHTGRRKLLNIHTQLGIFQSTPEHRWAVLDDLNGSVRWVSASDLTTNDALLHVPHVIPGGKTTLPSYTYTKPKYSTTTRDITIPDLDEDTAWLIGYFHGDGYVYRKDSTYGEVMFTCSPDMEKTSDKIKRNLERFNVNASITRTKHDNAIRVRVKSNQLANYFYQFKRPKESLIIPDFVLQGIPQIRAAYIAGVFDSDGSIKSRNRKKVRPIIASSIYPDWLRQLRAVMASMGISATIRQNRPKRGVWKALYRITTVSIESIPHLADYMVGISEKWENDAVNLERKKEQNSFVVPRNLLAQSSYRTLFDSAYYVPSSNISLSFSKFERTLRQSTHSSVAVESNSMTTDRIDRRGSFISLSQDYCLSSFGFKSASYHYYRPVKIKDVSTANSDETYDIQVEEDECFVAEGMLVHNSALISLSDLDDEEMRTAKVGQFYLMEPQRSLANNSAVYNEKPSAQEFLEEWLALARSGSGERGIFNRGGLRSQLPERRWKVFEKHAETAGTNPCGEIVLRSKQFCVGGDTHLITRDGIETIQDVVGKEIEVWNGKRWSRVVPVRTGRSQKLVRVTFGDGSYLDCTLDHKFSVRNRFQNKWYEVQAKDLTSFNRYTLQVEPTKIIYNDGQDYPDAYDLGVVVGDGHVYDDHVFVDLYGEKDFILPIKGIRHKEYLPSGYNLSKVRVRTELDAVLAKSLKTSANSLQLLFCWDRSSILNFVAGLIDADGSETKTGGARLYISDFGRARMVQLLLTKCGIRSSVNLMQKSGATTNLGIRKRDMYYIQITDCKEIPCKRVDTSNGHPARFKGKYQTIKSVVELEGLHDSFCFEESEEHKAVFNNVLTYQCNLTEIVARPEDTEESLLRKTRLATILGTYQATLTDFPYISKEWKKNCEEERLLGVSITGQWDSPETRNAKTLRKMRDLAIDVNREYAKRFGINPSTCITCVKPSGTVSQLVDASSGMHARHAKYYIRRVRISATDPLFQMLKEQKFPYYPEVGQTEDSASTFVLEFPVKAPEGSVMRNDLSAIDQLNHWKLVKENYTEHNPSVTVSVGEDEWVATADWLYENWNILGGLSFLPRTEHVYRLAPYEEITQEQYEEFISKVPEIDFSQILIYEKEDHTQGAKELACVGGVCEIDLSETMTAGARMTAKK